MTKELIECPYCGAYEEYDFEPEDYGDETETQVICDHCDKTFIAMAKHTIYFKTFKN